MKHQQLSRANGTKRPFLLALIAFSLGFCHYAEAKVQPTEAFTSNVDSLIINDNNKDKDETIYEAVDEMPKFPGEDSKPYSNIWEKTFNTRKKCRNLV
ncbi:hypothetical protein NXY28_13110 [Bacteroides thetaiotaomicron]|nr:hypothetical protein NXY28_13110 [Bacteroides thetaiotaomicron]